jgi:L-threonylcarbamoyladenylate synthase
MPIGFENDIERCIAVLQSGGSILYPTDTIWGIGCDATHEKAVANIYALKKRADEKSMIILLADEKELPYYIASGNPGIFDYVKGINKPTTVIYEAAQHLASNLINKDGSIAIRIVKDDFCKQLIRQFKKPIVSTSANISGYPPPGVFADIDAAIKNGVDYIVQHRQDDLTPASPSAIIKWKDDGSLHIIRS